MFVKSLHCYAEDVLFVYVPDRAGGSDLACHRKTALHAVQRTRVSGLSSPGHSLLRNVYVVLQLRLVFFLLSTQAGTSAASLKEGSLGCKYTFACFHSFIKLHGKQISQLLPPIRRPIPCSNAMEWPRIQLLLRLENDRWKFCSQCWSLHPHSKWRALQSTWKLHQKSFCSECHPPGAQKCYLPGAQKCFLPYAGDVDICPCLSITFHEKLHLIEACKSADTAASHEHEYSYANILRPSSLDNLRRGLSHKCTFADHPSAKVQRNIALD